MTHHTLWGCFGLAMLLALPIGCTAAPGKVTLIEQQQARVAIVTTARVMAADIDSNKKPALERNAETDRRRLRESVNDLSHYLGLIGSAQVPVLTDAAALPKGALPILIGEVAQDRFGACAVDAPGQQGLRVLVSQDAIALYGQSDLAASYAIYEVLDQLGCRWYFPGEMGEVIPRTGQVALAVQDLQTAPFTYYRSLWFGGDDYKRRNRCGGVYLSAGHALESYITAEQRQAHPEWRAEINGKPSNVRLKWSSPQVADAIADAIIARQDQDYQPTISLSPDDGAEFDESPEDRALDTGAIDEVIGTPVLTDRLVTLCNRIIEKVTAKYPDTLFGVLAYVQYTQPPARVKPHPNLVPQIAPITYRRAHTMLDEGVPGNPGLLNLVQGWAKLCPSLSYYWYGWFLAEATAPNPFMRKWGTELPILYQNHCRYWMPETIANFETTTHALYMSLRLAWDPQQKPQDIFDEINRNLYGHAAAEMAAYWQFVDESWVRVPEYSGCGFGHLVRFTPEVLAQWRSKMDAALAACRTPMEYRRVKLADDSLKLFELFMQLRRDLAEGRWSTLKTDSLRYESRLIALADEHADSVAFGRMYWTGHETIHSKYFRAFYDATYDSATDLVNQKRLLAAPVRKFQWALDPDQQSETKGWQNADFDASAWRSTDVSYETWSTIGHDNYLGTMWYRTSLRLGAAPTGKRVYLWIGATDGSAKVFVNGKHAPYVNDKGEKLDEFDGFCQPALVDITDVYQPNQVNQLTLRCTRKVVNELGTGGLLAPVAVACER